MFKKLFSRSSNPSEATDEKQDDANIQSAPSEKTSWFGRLRQGLQKTRAQFSEGLSRLFLGKKVIDQALFDALEEQLLLADVGIETTTYLIETLTQRASREALSNPEALWPMLKEMLTEILEPCEQPLTFESPDGPFVILMVGANGNGKTTTIGKLTRHLQASGKRVMLAAGDTFRAAAVEQLQAWGDRNAVPVVAQATGADSAAVIFDAFTSAKAKDIDVLIADTAGRLHTRDDLMEELLKIKRVLQKIDASAPHEIMLVIDAGTGQNALQQAKVFQENIGLSGITLTKLDGTARGGVIFPIARLCNLPIRYIGVGEGIEDLRTFHAKEFIDALFDEPEEDAPAE